MASNKVYISLTRKIKLLTLNHVKGFLLGMKKCGCYFSSQFDMVRKTLSSAITCTQVQVDAIFGV